MPLQVTRAAGFEKEIVIKRILPHFTEDESFVKMFSDEASIAAKLQHANIVQIFEDFEDIERYHVVMEYCRLGTLEDALDEDDVKGAMVLLITEARRLQQE